jgi:hypothetical protein
MAKDFESIQTISGNGSATTLSFTSIPNTYKNLHIRGIVRTARAVNTDGFFMYFNADSTDTNYYSHTFDGNSSGVTSSGTFNNGVYSRITVVPGANITANILGAFTCDILDYADTNKYKVSRAFGGCNLQTSGGEVRFASGLWMNGTAISTITFWNNNNTAFPTTTHLALYGIKG